MGLTYTLLRIRSYHSRNNYTKGNLFVCYEIFVYYWAQAKTICVNNSYLLQNSSLFKSRKTILSSTGRFSKHS